MTYGWALLVIVIAIAILLIINPFAPPQGCRFDQVGFSCNNPVIQSSSALFLQINNGNNNAIKVCKVVCTTDKTAPTLATCGTPLVTLRNGQTYETTVTGAGGHTTNCYTNAGATVLLNPAAGASVTAKVYLFYQNEEDTTSYPPRTAIATVTTKAVQ